MRLKKDNPKSQLSKRGLELIKSDVSEAYDSYQPGLTKRALYKTNDYETSRDLVQTTFFKTLLYLQRGGKIDIMRSFLNHILNDLIIDEYRKSKSVSLESLMESGFEIGFDDYEKITNIIDGKRLALLIPKLPKKYREVIHMRYMESMSLQEISFATHQSHNTVAVQAHRGLSKLKVIYTNQTKGKIGDKYPKKNR